ncbi:phenylacetate--CoA ligase family protein [Candidatus Nitrospira salsa]
MSLSSIQTCFELWQSRNLSSDELKRHQARKLRAMVRQAYDHVPFYRKIFDKKGITPDDILSAKDLYRLPIIRREDIQASPVEEFRAAGIDLQTCVVRRTGGSTGKPLNILTHRQDLEFEALAWIRTWLRLGLKITDRQVVIKDLNDHNFSDKTRWFQHLGFLQVRYVDLYKQVPLLLEELANCQLEVIRGSPTILGALAKEISKTPKYKEIRPRLIFTRGDILSAQVKSLLEENFGSRVVDCYGATEGGCIAWQCPNCGSYHVNEDLLVVEVIKNGQLVTPGEVGEVVITNLFSRAMPFIRYSLGDLCRIEDKTCGEHSGTLCLQPILGRTADQIVLRDGRVIQPDFFRPDEFEGVLEYQVIHERIHDGRIDQLTVRIVKDHDLHQEMLEAVRQKDQEFLGRECNLSIEFVDSIQVEGQAKFKRVISKVLTQAES